MRLRRAPLFGGVSVVVVLLAVGSASWACTGHTGSVWFCSSTSACSFTFRLSSMSDGATVYVNSQGFPTSGTGYTIRYRQGQDAADNCKDSTSTLGTATTGDVSGVGRTNYGWVGVAVTAPTAAGSNNYELCATTGTPIADAS